jgi:hypothetical protein
MDQPYKAPACGKGRQASETGVAVAFSNTRQLHGTATASLAGKDFDEAGP